MTVLPPPTRPHSQLAHSGAGALAALALVFAAGGTRAGTDAANGVAAKAPGSTNITLALTPCHLEHPARLTSPEAQCGELSVPENPTEPSGRQIRLYVARVPAINRRKRPDPLFVLAGGPGMAATTFYATAAVAFGRIHRDRDIILVDQRGTGHSNPLDCELNDDVAAETTGTDTIVQESQRCLREISQHANASFYTTSIAVQDLDRVRAALGYERINLYGGSYGTRVAQHYVRRFPQRARTVILDGVVPPELDLGPAIAVDAESALMRILARCVKDAPCQQHFGDPAQDYRKLRARLQAQAVSIALPDPTTGASSKLELTAVHLATVLRLSSYSPQEAAFLPLLLHAAATGDDFKLLASQFLLSSKALGDVISYGMHNSVVCSEDVPFYDRKAIDRHAIEQTYLGTLELDALEAVCKFWPHGPVDPDFHAPLSAATAALLLSGSDDPVTPPAYAEQAQHGFRDSLHIRMEGFGHGQLVAPCMDRVMASFLDLGTAKGLDVSCARLDRPAAFFLSVSGPAP